MTREWKPGDVAVVTYGGGEFSDIGLRADPDGWDVAAGHIKDASVRSVRRLVVIDPEDREQVERLAQTYKDDYWTSSEPVTPEHVLSLQAALRELANPTPSKPDEPQGLGAVVEAQCACEEEAQIFIRNHHVDPEIPWEAACGWHRWHELRDSIRVLSEGIKEGDR